MRRQPLLQLVLLAVLVTALADSNSNPPPTGPNYSPPDPATGMMDSSPSYPLQYPPVGQQTPEMNHFIPYSSPEISPAETETEEGTTFTYSHQSYSSYALPQIQPQPQPYPTTPAGYSAAAGGPQETKSYQGYQEQQYGHGQSGQGGQEGQGQGQEGKEAGKTETAEPQGPPANLNGMPYSYPSFSPYLPKAPSSLPVEYTQHAHPHVMLFSGPKLGLMLRTGSFRWMSPEGKEYHVNYKANPMTNYLTQTPAEPKLPGPIIPLMTEIYGQPSTYPSQEPPSHYQQEPAAGGPPPPIYQPQEPLNHYEQEPLETYPESYQEPPRKIRPPTYQPQEPANHYEQEPPPESYQEPPRKIRPPPPQKMIKNHIHSHKQMKKPKFNKSPLPHHQTPNKNNRHKNQHHQQPPPRRPQSQQQQQQQRQPPFRGRQPPQRTQKPKPPMYKRNIM